MNKNISDNPYLTAVDSLQKMIDAEVIDITEDDDGNPKLILTQEAYDAFFFADTIQMNDDVKAWQKAWIYILILLRWLFSFIHKTTVWDEKIMQYVHRHHWFDEPKALAFLDKVRFFINWRRGYVAGLRNFGRDDLTPEEEKEQLHKLRIHDGEWIIFFVVNSEYKPILIGRWVEDRFEIKNYAPEQTHNS